MNINSISPIDGRYSSKTSLLSPFFSEKALMQYRILVETNYLLLLSKEGKIGLRKFNKQEIELLQNLHNLTDEQALIIKQIETTGYDNIAATNHDVKAVEYFIKFRLSETSLEDIVEIVHFGLTSEDINNIAYALMIKDGFNKVVFPQIINIYESLYNLSLTYKNCPMLARTHGQPASPTSFGKEMIVFVSRIKEEVALLNSIPILVKFNGATGNHNAHVATFANIDWLEFSRLFIEEIKQIEKNKVPKFCSCLALCIKHNRITTQIEPHDSYARVFDSIKRINTILIDFCQDMWRYISDGWIKQKAIKGEIGSSAMPHKINPIDFENAEGNLGIANSLLNFFSSKLSISRLQRDLSDSTVLRNIGVAFAHSLIAYQSILKGLSKINIHKEALLSALNKNPEVIAEAFQNILRIEGIDKPYELLKEITRGKDTTLEDFYDLVKKLDINEKTKNKLLSIKPENYTGIASKIVEEFDAKIF